MSAGIGTVTKIDPQGRLHIPKDVMGVLGLCKNSPVIVTLDLEEGSFIKIYPAGEFLDGQTIEAINEAKNEKEIIKR